MKNESEKMDGLELYLFLSDILEEIQFELDLYLCNIAAQAIVSGNDTEYLMSAIELNTRYNMLSCVHRGNRAVIDKYIDDKIAEGLEEYRHVKFAFSGRSFDELMTHIK